MSADTRKFSNHMAIKTHELVKKHLEDGMRYCQSGKLEKAAAEIRRAMSYDLYNPLIYRELGLVAYFQGNVQEAVSEYKRSLELNRNDPETFYRLGCCYLYVKQFAKTIECFESALTLEPNHARTCYALGIAYEAMGDMQKASTWRQRGMNLSPKVNEQILLSPGEQRKTQSTGLNYLVDTLTQTLSDVSTEMLQQTKKQLPTITRQTQKQRPPQTEFQKLLENARKDFSEGKYARAQEKYKKALIMTQSSSLVYHGIGRTYFYMGQIEEAIPYFEKSVECDPDFVGGYYYLGCACHAKKKIPEAITYYRRAISIDPTFAEARYALGMALQDTGKQIEGFDEMQKAVRLVKDVKDIVPALLTSTGKSAKKQRNENESQGFFHAAFSLVFYGTISTAAALLDVVTGGKTTAHAQAQAQKKGKAASPGMLVKIKEKLQAYLKKKE